MPSPLGFPGISPENPRGHVWFKSSLNRGTALCAAPAHPCIDQLTRKKQIHGYASIDGSPFNRPYPHDTSARSPLAKVGQRTTSRRTRHSQRQGDCTPHPSTALAAFRHGNAGALSEAAYALWQARRLASHRRARLVDATHGDRSCGHDQCVRLHAFAAEPSPATTRIHLDVQDASTVGESPLCAMTDILAPTCRRCLQSKAMQAVDIVNSPPRRSSGCETCCE